ncbi:MAG: hypothetical protein EA399_07840 [Desulfovibrionales bacterium]|nr:MAG: hypothetical protein EA399_07840 [Desulfovibrionales bacterium]
MAEHDYSKDQRTPPPLDSARGDRLRVELDRVAQEAEPVDWSDPEQSGDYLFQTTLMQFRSLKENRKRIEGELTPDKLPNTQLQPRLDPQLFQAGMTIAGYYVEGGLRNFEDYAKAMINDLGKAAKPFLRSWYEGVRYYPGFDNTGMTPAEQIEQNTSTQFLGAITPDETGVIVTPQHEGNVEQQLMEPDELEDDLEPEPKDYQALLPFPQSEKYWMPEDGPSILAVQVHETTTEISSRDHLLNLLVMRLRSMVQMSDEPEYDVEMMLKFLNEKGLIDPNVDEGLLVKADPLEWEQLFYRPELRSLMWMAMEDLEFPIPVPDSDPEAREVFEDGNLVDWTGWLVFLLRM